MRMTGSRYRRLKARRSVLLRRFFRRRYSLHNTGRPRMGLLQITAGGMVVVLAVSVVSQSLLSVVFDKQHQLSPEMYRLVGESRDDTKEHLTLNQEGSSYSFTIPKNTENADESVHTGRVADAYSASLGVNPKDGVTITDTATQIGATIIPDFYARGAQKVEGDHIVYASGKNKLVYTLKYNGLKEDIIIPTYQADELSFKFKLQLPVGAEARLQDDGSIGVYSSDPTLFGNISFGSEEDREKVEKARENGEKNYLLMNIPTPLVKDNSGKEHLDKARFRLGSKETIERRDNSAQAAQLPAGVPRSLVSVNQYQLTLSGNKLKELPYPISLDPTMQVTAGGDFEDINLESGVTVDPTNNLIRRSSLTGGALNASWTSSMSNMQLALNHAVVATDDYVYTIGNGTSLGNFVGNGQVQFAPINANGSLGAWATTTSLTNSNRAHVSAAAYNGYMYVYGGHEMVPFSPGQSIDDVEYAVINDNGTLGAWQSAGNAADDLPTPTRDGGHFVSNGYLYLLGGTNCLTNNTCTPTANTYYAKLNADGSLASNTGCGSTWCTTTALPAVNENVRTAYFNDVVYTNNSTDSAVQYARVNENGTLSSWTATSAPLITNPPSTIRTDWALAAGGGYVYIIAGYTNANGTRQTQVDYAQTNADGSLGIVRTTTPIPSARQDVGALYANGNIYITGGSDGTGGSTPASGYNIAQKPAGELHNSAWTAGTVIPGQRNGVATVAHNGFLYAIGGCNGALCITAHNQVYFARFGADGGFVNGVCGQQWCANGNVLPANRVGAVMVAHNARLYVIGGCTSGNCNNTSVNTTYYADAWDIQGAGAWTTDGDNNPGGDTPMSVNRAFHAAAVYNGYIYVAGGCNGATCSNNPLNTVEYAPINSDGSIGTWSSGGTFANARYHTRMAAWGGYLYLSGGANGGTPYGDVQYAKINTNGSLAGDADGVGSCVTTWCPASSLLATRGGHGMVAYNGYLYTYGGCVDTACATPATNTEYAKLNADGSVETWTVTQAMPTVRSIFGYAVNNGYLYSVGGSDGNPSDLVTYQKINNGGSGATGAWTDLNATPMLAARQKPGATAHNGYVYTTGGCSVENCGSNSQQNDSQYAKVNADGTLQSFQTGAFMAAGRADHGAAVVNGRLYVVGGYTAPANTLVATVESSALNPSTGATGAWRSETAMSEPRRGHSLVTYGDYLYVVGGFTNTGGSTNLTAVYAKVNSDGTFASDADGAGSCVTAWCPTTSLPAAAPVNGAASAVHGGYVYRMSGSDNLGFRLRTIYYAQLNADGLGGIGTWQLARSTMPEPFVNGIGFTQNGYLYALGESQEDFGCVPVTMSAPLLPSHDVGPWEVSSRAAGNQVSPGLAYSNGNVYILGGQTCGAGPTNLVRRAQVQSIPRVGSFSKRYDFEVGVRPTKLVTRGSDLASSLLSVSYANNQSCNNTVFDNAQTVSDAGFYSDDTLTISIGTARTLARCLFLRYTMDDSYSAVFPDGGNESTITDFDMYFIANPGKRLRGGRTFTNGADRGLGAQP